MEKKLGVKLGTGNLLFPKVDPTNPIDSAGDHLAQGDILLGAILDVAERGHQEAEIAGQLEADQRFNTIIELVQMYRAGVEVLDVELSKLRAVKTA